MQVEEEERRQTEMSRQRETEMEERDTSNERGRCTQTRKRERLEMVITEKGNELFPSTPRSNARRHVRTHACACVRVTFHRGTPNGWLTAVKGMRV